MQVFMETVNSYLKQGYRRNQFMLGYRDSEIIYKAAKGNSEAKLKLVKSHLDMIVEIAAEYSARTGRPFFLMVQAGTMAVIRTAEKSNGYNYIDFNDRVKGEIIKAMKEIL